MHSEAIRAAQLAWEALVAVVSTHGDAGVQSLARVLYGALAPWVEAVGSLEVRRAGPFLTVNNVRVGGAPAERGLVRRAVELLRLAGLDGLRLTRGVTPAEFETWVELASEPAMAHHAAGGIQVQLRAAGVCHIEALASSPSERRGAVLLPAHRQQAFAAYVGALTSQRAYAVALSHGEPTSLHPLRRSVHRLVDTLLEDDTALIGLASLRSLRLEGGVTVPAHAVNVTVLSLALGCASGFGRADLAALGLAALLHDVGTFAGVLDGDVPRRDSLAAHAVRGAARLVRSGALDTVGTAALVALEHHVHAGEQSAPRIATRWELSTAACIVQIADAFDRALDASPESGSAVYCARDALGALQRQAESCFDPGWVARFVRLLGGYPPTTLVQLEGGNIGLVVRANREPHGFERPIVRLLLDATGQPFADEPIVDLTAPDAPGVHAVLSAEPLGIDPVALFLP